MTTTQAPADQSPPITLRGLFEAGAHFGHPTKRWHPKMKPYIFTSRNKIHVFDLAKTIARLETAADFVEKRITERYASEGQNVAAYHESMLAVVAEIAAFNTLKFKNDIQWELNTVCEVNLLNNQISKRKLLKAPRCPVCSGVSKRPQVNIHQQLTSDESWQEIEQTVGYDE